MTRGLRAAGSILLAAATAAAFAPARADPGSSWEYSSLGKASGLVRLAYGVPDADGALVTIDCRRHSGWIVINTFGVSAPKGAVARLTAGGETLTQGSRVEPNEASDGVVIETRLRTTAPVIRAFRHGAPLTIRAAHDVTRLPRVDRKAAEAFFQTCG